MWALCKWLVWHCLEEQPTLCTHPALPYISQQLLKYWKKSWTCITAPCDAQVTFCPWVSLHYLISDVPPWSFLLECAQFSTLPLFLPPVINNRLRLSLRPWPWQLLMRGWKTIHSLIYLSCWWRENSKSTIVYRHSRMLTSRSRR